MFEGAPVHTVHESFEEFQIFGYDPLPLLSEVGDTCTTSHRNTAKIVDRNLVFVRLDVGEMPFSRNHFARCVRLQRRLISVDAADEPLPALPGEAGAACACAFGRAERSRRAEGS